MRYRVFEDQASASSYADAQTALLPGRGEDATRLWDVPRRIGDGRWIVASGDSDGEEWSEAFAAPAEE